jgi:hypothetical protein
MFTNAKVRNIIEKKKQQQKEKNKLLAISDKDQQCSLPHVGRLNGDSSFPFE